MAKKNLAENIADITPINEGKTHSVPDITCLARTIECFDNQGFREFRIVTLHIEHGMVVKVERTDSWANFETISRMELFTEVGMMNLNNHWKPGVFLSK